VLETALSSQSSLMTFDRALATAADGLGVPIRS
jgi:hypothetical protein